jgi:hypothetical protein
MGGGRREEGGGRREEGGGRREEGGGRREEGPEAISSAVLDACPFSSKKFYFSRCLFVSNSKPTKFSF